ncbi:protein unc-13 [Salvia divinorum]|uniref:Protein unc-13 n=1 Tax=Salvia divinorum TaxID=28513 RepID=A0ABD1I2E0_SALDI
MAHPLRLPTTNPRAAPPALEAVSPFDKIDGLDRDDFREAAYEVFFTACRASPGFGGRSQITYYNSLDEGGDGSGSPRAGGVGMAVTSRVKRALGLKMLRRSTSRRGSSCGSNPSSPSSGSPRVSPSSVLKRRPMTSAEIMRQQMWVTEQSDNRLRKTLMRTLVGQMGRRAETIILPLELLRHLKPSEFADANEYHQWQKRQLRVLEAGLLLFPSTPLDPSDPSAAKLRSIIESAKGKPLDTGKNSETMRSLCSSVVSLAWRSAVAPEGRSTDASHWADGYPLNAEIYKSLLQVIFDIRDETLVLDEVDELLELMKKTWSTLGIGKPVHNLLLAWVFFEQYVRTGQAEADLFAACLTMLSTEVANDAKKARREAGYMRMLAEMLVAMNKWCGMRLVDYHGNFDEGTVGLMESILPLVFSATKILEEDVPTYITPHLDKGGEIDFDSTGNKVDYFIRSSSRNAFAKMMEEQNASNVETHRVSEMMIKLARETEQVASKEKAIFSPVTKKWHPIAAGVSAVTLHTCYGVLLRQYLDSTAAAEMNETILVLQRAGKLEKALVQMVVEDSVECADGGKAIVREMLPFEVDAIILRFLKHWMQEKLKIGKDKLHTAKETETWNPKSKSEPYSRSAEEIIKFCKDTIENFFEIPINVSESVVYDLTDGLEHLLGEYITFIASCGSKQGYLPTLPPLTRCSKGSKFVKLWKKAACNVGTEHQEANQNNTAGAVTVMGEEGNPNPRPSTSRGTQRLYIRLNTLHYLTKHLHSLEKTLSLSPKVTPSKSRRRRHSYFEHTRSAIQASQQHVAEVAAYRLVFLDSSSVLYGSLYNPDVGSARIKPALRVLKQNLTLLCAIVKEHVQGAAVRHVMAAYFEAYLMVLLAGGSSRIFYRADHAMIEQDFEGLRGLFREGLVGEDEVAAAAEVVEGVVALMEQTTEQLVEDFSVLACEANGAAVGAGAGQKLPMPPTTGKWSRSDPNTILRVLCHRNDRAANSFLKRTFRLAKRNGSL